VLFIGENPIDGHPAWNTDIIWANITPTTVAYNAASIINEHVNMIVMMENKLN